MLKLSILFTYITDRTNSAEEHSHVSAAYWRGEAIAMLATVADILKVEPISMGRLVAGGNGLNRVVRGVTVLEVSCTCRDALRW